MRERIYCLTGHSYSTNESLQQAGKLLEYHVQDFAHTLLSIRTILTDEEKKLSGDSSVTSCRERANSSDQAPPPPKLGFLQPKFLLTDCKELSPPHLTEEENLECISSFRKRTRTRAETSPILEVLQAMVEKKQRAASFS